MLPSGAQESEPRPAGPAPPKAPSLAHRGSPSPVLTQSSLCVGVLTSASYKDTGYVEPGPTLRISFKAPRPREQTCGCQGEGARGGREREIRVNTCKLSYTGWTNDEVLLQSTENYVQRTVIHHMEKNMEKNVYNSHFAVQKKLTLEINYAWI